jgi:hypothetical protein
MEENLHGAIVILMRIPGSSGTGEQVHAIVVYVNLNSLSFLK